MAGLWIHQRRVRQKWIWIGIRRARGLSGGLQSFRFRLLEENREYNFDGLWPFALVWSLNMFRILFLLLTILTASYAKAQEFKYPKIEPARISWGEVNEELRRLSPPTAGQSGKPLLDVLNDEIAKDFPWAARSVVPLLLPMDVKAYLEDRESPVAVKPAEVYFFAGISAVDAADIGNAGYDIILSKTVGGTVKLVTLSANALVYEVPWVRTKRTIINASVSGSKTEVASFTLEDEQRLSFEKYGINYVLSLPCTPPQTRGKRCEAERDLLLTIVETLSFAGGERPGAAYETKHGLVPRPKEYSPDFKFHAPGDLKNGSGAGRADYTVYAALHFPLKDGPAFANSQIFADGGNCLNTKLNLSGD